MHSVSPLHQLNAHGDERATKRRKVRKGTQSCWECKKRKVRCIWASPTKSECDNCVRRKTNCVSQEFSDEPVPNTKGAAGLETRLSRVEHLLEQLIGSTTDRRHDIADECLAARDSGSSRSTDRLRNLNITPSASPEPTPTPPADPSRHVEAELSSLYTGISRDLIAAWPSAHDLDYICNLPVEPWTHLHITKLTSTCTQLMYQTPVSARDMLQLPPPESHPVLLARKLLVLSNLLQGALSADQIPKSRRGHFTTVMSRAMDTATRLVTSNDELTVSVEGVECIMIEAMVQNYAGNLHRAWMTTRRAAAVAQMLCLHRGSKVASRKVLDPKTREFVDAEQLCFRIVETDRYLSLTLGLPQSSLQTSGFDAETIAKCDPIDRISRLHCVIGDRILSRRVGEPRDLTAESIREIDGMLEEAAALMPSQWWLVPDSEKNDGDELSTIHEVARNMFQLSHFYLVVRLHLPYVLRSPGNGRCEHSQAAAVHAAREILSRYIAFRKWKTGLYYCRGVDFLSFIALTVLCLAHIDSQNRSTVQQRILLGHSRLSDRAMMECTLKLLQEMRDDAIATKLSRIMQYLLDVEAASANGIGYSTSTSEGDDGLPTDCDGQFLDAEKGVLQLHIPYFGTISLERKPAPDSAVAEGMLSTQVFEQAQPLTEWDNQWSLLDSSDDMGTFDDWTLQNINEGLFGGLLGGLGDVELEPRFSVDM